jgi:hypothetical protein
MTLKKENTISELSTTLRNINIPSRVETPLVGGIISNYLY